MVFFFTWNFFSSLCCGEMFLILWGPIPVLQGLWCFSCSLFLILLTASFFLFPRILLLFYYSTDTVFLLNSFLPFLFNHHLLGRWFVSDSLQVFLGWYCKFSELVFALGWVVDFLEVFFSICTLSRTCLWCQHRRAVGNHLISGASPCPLLLMLQKVRLW